ncbi:MAG: DUF86 domain-containing protein [Bacteroidales bacterium]|jgi:uncharacterized protein YutE (UPF0331/DUF86 family)|nr:DUF86 domain-containing protein [Bacteroidales bacterium]
MKYNGIIESKLRIIEQKLAEIESWNILSFNQLAESSLLQNAVERALQICIEVMIDISERILALNKERPLPTSNENIIRLQELGIISAKPEYNDMVKFRNFIVHRYEKIDLEIIYGILKNKLFLFSEFVNDIRKS